MPDEIPGPKIDYEALGRLAGHAIARLWDLAEQRLPDVQERAGEALRNGGQAVRDLAEQVVTNTRDATGRAIDQARQLFTRRSGG